MKIKLWDLVGLGLIVKSNSGCVYENQTGGTACFKSKVEGYFCPLYDEMGEKSLESNLNALTSNSTRLGTGTVAAINESFSNNPDFNFLSEY